MERKKPNPKAMNPQLTEEEIKNITDEAEELYPDDNSNGKEIYTIDEVISAKREANISAATRYALLLKDERERAGKLVEELLRLADNEGECCMRCEGNGKLWADGKAHYPSYNGPTVNCGNCGGEGKIYPNIQEEIHNAINKYKSTI